MTELTHSKFLSFLKKYWFLITATIVIVFNIVDRLFAISYHIETIQSISKILDEYAQSKEQNNAITENLTNGNNKLILYNVINIFSILLSVSLLFILYIFQLKKHTKSRILLVSTSVITLLVVSWLIYYIVLNVDSLITSYNSIAIPQNRTIGQVLLPMVILDIVTILLNICLTIIIYIRHFYRKKEQIEIN